MHLTFFVIVFRFRFRNPRDEGDFKGHSIKTLLVVKDVDCKSGMLIVYINFMI